MNFRFPAVVLLAMASLLPIGCEKGGIKTVPVRGRLTYAGGEWPKGGMLTFASVEPAPGMTQHPGTAEFGTDGRFAASTFGDGDGLVPGKYVVNIECWEVPPSPDNPVAAKSYLPTKYQSGMHSGFTVDVPADHRGALEVTFDVPKP